MPAIAETFEIKAYNNDSTAVVFDMTDYLLSDKKNLSPFSPYSMMEMMGADISKDFEKESSFIQGVKGFEDNQRGYEGKLCSEENAVYCGYES